MQKFFDYIKSQGFDMLFLIGLIFASGALYTKVQVNSDRIVTTEARLSSEIKAVEARLSSELKAAETRTNKRFDEIDSKLGQIESVLKELSSKLDTIAKQTAVNHSMVVSHEARLNQVEIELLQIVRSQK